MSSANKYILLDILSIMSLMKMINNNGPRTLPCAIPLVTLDHVEYVPLITTRCELFVKKVLIRSRIGLVIPYSL